MTYIGFNKNIVVPKHPNNKKYTFSDFIITDDRAWPTEKRIDWANKSKQSLASIARKYATGHRCMPQDEL